MDHSLNKWMTGSTSGWYSETTAPSGSQLQHDVVLDVANDYTLGTDANETAGGTHHNGHPASETIYHWIAAYKYSSSGATIGFADPSTSVWSTVQPYFTYSPGSFASHFLTVHGIAW